MNYVDSFSPHMRDLQNEDVRNNLLKFAQNFFDAIVEKQHTLKTYQPISWQPIRYQYRTSFKKLDTAGKKIIVVTDSLENQNLSEMIKAFRNSFGQDIELVNLQDIDIKGSLLHAYASYNSYQETPFVR